MYCKKCGKFIGNDADLCDECLAKEQAVFSEFSEPAPETPAPVYYQESAYNAGAQIKLGKSIAAAVLSYLGFLIIYIGFMIMAELASYGSDISVATAFVLIGCIPNVLGLIFGIQSIKHFKATSMIRSGKRIPVLILGISSVVMAGIGLFVAIIALMLGSMI